MPKNAIIYNTIIIYSFNYDVKIYAQYFGKPKTPSTPYWVEGIFNLITAQSSEGYWKTVSYVPLSNSYSSLSR